MDKTTRSTSEKVEIASIRIEEGLRALNELAKQSANQQITGATLATCVEQMTSSMLANIRALYNIVDGGASHG